MLRWLERGALVLLGAGVASVIFWLFGKVTFGGDFLANVAGASIGGLVSVGLALGMYHHERKTARLDAEGAVRDRIEQDIVNALSYVTTIQDCITRARQITINTSAERTQDLIDASAASENYADAFAGADFALRRAMTQAARIGYQTVERLRVAMQAPVVNHADDPVLAVTAYCDEALRDIATVKQTYRDQRDPRLGR